MFMKLAPLGGGLYGGMARVAHVVDSLKAINPNTYLFMSGDFLNPSLLGNLKHEGQRIKGRQMIEVMNAMNFTMATFGNHEFDLSYDDFQKRLDESSFDWVNTNCYHNTERGIIPFSKVTTLEHNSEAKDLEFQAHMSEIIPEIKMLNVANNRGQTLDIGFFCVTIRAIPNLMCIMRTCFNKPNTGLIPQAIGRGYHRWSYSCRYRDGPRNCQK